MAHRLHGEGVMNLNGCTPRVIVTLVLALTMLSHATAQRILPSVDHVNLRGQTFAVHLYGSRGGQPILLSSGYGGWAHLAPHVAEMLAAAGLFVVGFDAKAYLSHFTTSGRTLTVAQEPGDYAALVEYAAGGSGRKAILVGVSEGAGLSVLAAADARVKPLVAGVIGLGLPDRNELGWRWTDSMIYFTHALPNEPTFSTAAIAKGLAPLPLGAIHSSRDEFVPLTEVEHVLEAATGPQRLWVVHAANHRFSGGMAEFDRRLLEAIDWVRRSAPVN
jgi:fermentation-respiration switch protein FrsA (DUF1100 family)